MLPKILKNFNVFVDGRGYAGKIDEVTLPKLTIKTEEYRAGGMDIPINIDMGMEKLEADFTFSEYDSELFRLFGLINNNAVSLTLRGGLHNHPGGSLEPSKEDQAVTKSLAAACSTVSVKLFDHIIITSGGYFSFRENGLL